MCKICPVSEKPTLSVCVWTVSGGHSMGGALAFHFGYRFCTDLAGVFALSAFLSEKSSVYGVSSFAFCSVILSFLYFPSVLWRCWLGSRKGIRPVKKLSGRVLAWLCVERGADLHIAQLMPLLLTVSCFSKIQIGCTFLVPAHLRRPGQRAVKEVCVFL